MALDRDYLGFAGIGYIGSTALFLTSGSMAWGDSRVYQNMVLSPIPQQDPFVASPITRVLHSDGVAIANASLSWDMDINQLSLLQDLTDRGRPFAVKIFDGEVGKQFTTAWCESFSASASVGGLVACEASFQALAEPTDYDGGSVLDKDDALVGYWNTGSTSIDEVTDWSLAVNHGLEPKYTNLANSSNYPTYFRFLDTTVELSITTYEEIQEFWNDSTLHTHNLSVGIGNYEIVGVIDQQRNWNFNGIESPGNFSYTFSSCKLMVKDVGEDHYGGEGYVNSQVETLTAPA